MPANCQWKSVEKLVPPPSWFRWFVYFLLSKHQSITLAVYPSCTFLRTLCWVAWFNIAMPISLAVSLISSLCSTEIEKTQISLRTFHQSFQKLVWQSLVPSGVGNNYSDEFQGKNPVGRVFWSCQSTVCIFCVTYFQFPSPKLQSLVTCKYIVQPLRWLLGCTESSKNFCKNYQAANSVLLLQCRRNCLWYHVQEAFHKLRTFRALCDALTSERKCGKIFVWVHFFAISLERTPNSAIVVPIGVRRLSSLGTVDSSRIAFVSKSSTPPSATMASTAASSRVALHSKDDSKDDSLEAWAWM